MAPYRIYGQTFSDGTIDKDIAISSLPTNLICNYAHARISNSKLNIVIALYSNNTGAIPQSLEIKVDTLGLISTILSQLYPTIGGYLDAKVNLVGNASTQSTSSLTAIGINVTKTASGLSFYIYHPQLS